MDCHEFASVNSHNDEMARNLNKVDKAQSRADKHKQKFKNIK